MARCRWPRIGEAIETRLQQLYGQLRAESKLGVARWCRRQQGGCGNGPWPKERCGLADRSCLRREAQDVVSCREPGEGERDRERKKKKKKKKS
jgi:hypothetical protein